LKIGTGPLPTAAVAGAEALAIGMSAACTGATSATNAAAQMLAKLMRFICALRIVQISGRKITPMPEYGLVQKCNTLTEQCDGGQYEHRTA
jgi:hypothetical protein